MSTTPDPTPAPPLAKVRAHTPAAGAGSTRRAADPMKSRQRDPFARLYQDGFALRPPYSYAALALLHDQSDALAAALSAMETNVAGFGVQLVARRKPRGEAEEAAAAAEKVRMENFFRFASGDLTFTALRRRARVDLDLFGDGYWEMLRDGKGRLCGIEHGRAFYFRKGSLSDPIEVDRWVLTPEGTWSKQKVWRRFRTFVELIDGSPRYFKQWGDPRRIDAETGRELKADERDEGARLATEVLNFSHYAPDSPYGKPQWRGAAVDIAGRTAAAEVNFDLFDGKAIPPWLITVAGATITPDVVARIQAHFAGLRGRENYHAPLILEAVPMSENLTGEGPVPPVKIEVKDLTGGIADDGQFSKYRGEGAENVAMAFRLPRLYLGRSQDYNRATAEAAKLVAEEQVFEPERAEEAEILNREVLPELDAQWWEVKVAGPPQLGEDVLIRLIEVGIKAGVLTPAQVAELLEPLVGQELTLTEKWSKLPVMILTALVESGQLPPDLAEELGVAPAAKPSGGEGNSGAKPAG